MTLIGTANHAGIDLVDEPQRAVGWLTRYFEDLDARPNILPLWQRYPRAKFPVEFVEWVRGQGITPWFYLTSRDSVPADDEGAPPWASHLHPGDVVRFNQEPNGKWKAPWARWSPERYIETFRRYSDIIHDAQSEARMYFCLIQRRKKFDGDFATYYPGDEYVDLVGYDMYADARTPVPLGPRIERAMKVARETTDKPFALGEVGIDVDSRYRRWWIRQGIRAARSLGVEAFVYFDYEMAPGAYEGHDWRLGPREVRSLGRMVR